MIKIIGLEPGLDKERLLDFAEVLAESKYNDNMGQFHMLMLKKRRLLRMDKIFRYGDKRIKEILQQFSSEVCENDYIENIDIYNEVFPVGNVIVVNAIHHLKAVPAEQRTILNALKYVQQIVSEDETTEEDEYIQDGIITPHKEHTYHVYLYCVRLLKQIYLYYDKDNSPQEWEMITKLYEEAEKRTNLIQGSRGDIRKKNIGPLTEEDLPWSAESFITELTQHLDSFYYGQTPVKKMMIGVLFSWIFMNERSTTLLIGPTGSGKTYLMEQLASFLGNYIPVISYTASKFTPEGYKGENVSNLLLYIKAKLDEAKTRRAIVFLDEIDKVIDSPVDSEGDRFLAGVQKQLLTLLSGTENSGVDTSNLMFVLGGAFSRLYTNTTIRDIGFMRNGEPRNTAKNEGSIRERLCNLGALAEFIGRIENVIQLDAPTGESLRSMLMNERYGQFYQRKRLFQKAGIALSIDEEVIDALVDQALKENLGMRSIRNKLYEFVHPGVLTSLLQEHRHSFRITKELLEKRGE